MLQGVKECRYDYVIAVSDLDSLGSPIRVFRPEADGHKSELLSWMYMPSLVGNVLGNPTFPGIYRTSIAVYDVSCDR